jgi:ankyrin repeat protein
MDDQVPLEFDLAIGMRRDDAVMKYKLDAALKESGDEIATILKEFGVPLVQCSRCIVTGEVPSHGSYYTQLRQVSLDRFLASSQHAPLSSDATKDQIVDRARLEGWLEDGADPNIELANAVLAGDPDRVSFLIEKGADLKRRDSGGYQPLQSAARHRNDRLIELLISLGADPNGADSSGWTALMHAGYRNHVPSVKALIDGGADIEKTDRDGYSALALTIGEQKYFAAQALIEAGADVKTPVGPQKLTPLMLVASMPDAETREGQLVGGKGAIETARAMIEKGADVNARSEAGVTPLMVAAANNRSSMLGFLLQQGADANLKNAGGKTALDLARENLSEASEVALRLLTDASDPGLTR